jgi:hypothetical protein
MAIKPDDRLPPPASLARRHFMRIVAAGAGKVSAIAVSSALLASKSANAMGLFPRGNPDDKPNHGGHCLGRGTLIRTARGEMPVEDLTIGDMVMTTSGAFPVKFVGRQTMRKNASASWHPSVLPIRVEKYAIDDQTPQRDVYLSQGHSLFIDGFLIPVKHLVNDRSIAVAEASETIEHFSVELDSHQVIFADGMAVETFQYAGGQVTWDNLGEYQALYGEHKMMPAFAPHCRYAGGRAEVRALLRLAASRFADVRDPIQVAYARIASRVMSIAA